MTTIALLDITNNALSAPPLTLALVMNPPNTVVTRGTNFGAPGQPTLQLVADGGVAPYTYSTSTDLTGTGVTLHADGTITGEPLAIGQIIFNATATDAATNTITITDFRITVVSRLVLVALPPPGEHGVAGSFQFAVTGNTGTVAWGLTSGPLPSGGSLTVGGLLSWLSATAPAQYHLVIRATDSITGDILQFGFYLDIHAQFSVPGSGSGGGGAGSFPTSVPFSLNVGTLSGVGPWKISNAFMSVAWASYKFNGGNTIGAASPGAVITVSGTAPAASYPLPTQQVLLMTFDITDAAGATLTAVQIYATFTNKPVPSLDAGNSLTYGSDNALYVAAPAAEHRVIVGGFNNGAIALSGSTSVDVFVPYNFTITGWRMGGDGTSGSGTIDVLEATPGGYPSFSSITASATPAVAGATSGNNSTLTGWTKTFTGGVWLRFTGSGFANWTRATLNLEVSTP